MMVMMMVLDQPVPFSEMGMGLLDANVDAAGSVTAFCLLFFVVLLLVFFFFSFLVWKTSQRIEFNRSTVQQAAVTT